MKPTNKIERKRLGLRTETVRVLKADDLDGVQGGADQWSESILPSCNGSCFSVNNGICCTRR